MCLRSKIAARPPKERALENAAPTFAQGYGLMRGLLRRMSDDPSATLVIPSIDERVAVCLQYGVKICLASDSLWAGPLRNAAS